MKRILIAYYSRSGNTRRVAPRLAADLGADLEEIVDPTRISGLLPAPCADCAART